MMVKSKDKGTRWERDAVDILNKEYEEAWKRVPGSGSFGTMLEIPDLAADLIGDYYFLPFKFRVDAKTGYGGATQLTVKREWLEKIRKEAEEQQNHEVPMLMCKFSNSRTDVRYFIVADFDAFHDILKSYEDLYQENIRLREALQNYGQ